MSEFELPSLEGRKWTELITQEEAHYEAAFMHHAVNMYFDATHGKGNRFFSLRLSDDTPAATCMIEHNRIALVVAYENKNPFPVFEKDVQLLSEQLGVHFSKRSYPYTISNVENNTVLDTFGGEKIPLKNLVDLYFNELELPQGIEVFYTNVISLGNERDGEIVIATSKEDARNFIKNNDTIRQMDWISIKEFSHIVDIMEEKSNVEPMIFRCSKPEEFPQLVSMIKNLVETAHITPNANELINTSFPKI